MARYKPGDRVIVREDLIEKKRYYMEDHHWDDTVAPEMIRFAGKVVTIKKSWEKYSIEECLWNWTDEMFVGLEAEVLLVEVDDLLL